MGFGKKFVCYVMICEGDVYYFVLIMYYVFYDGWLMFLVVDCVNQVYQGVVLRKLVVQFKYFIDYFNNRFDCVGCDIYWCEQFDGVMGVQFFWFFFEGYQIQVDFFFEVDIKFDGWKFLLVFGVIIIFVSVVCVVWVLVVFQYCSGNNDIVFGEILIGCNVFIVGIEEIEGFMIIIVFVWVIINCELFVEQYFQIIVEQIVGQILYEYVGFQYICKLSDDVFQVCELCIGFVLYFVVGEVEVDDKILVNGLVLVGDGEVVQEVFKFNMYVFMLVCFFFFDGFFVMVSFDFKMVSKDMME